MNEEQYLSVLNHLYRVSGSKVETCLEPSEMCTEKAIRAHSIPCSSVLSKVAEDGHVIMPHIRLRMPSPPETSFQKVGIHQASTFTGLCSSHDNAIFQPIDVEPDLSNSEHLFLLAYRAVLRELHTTMQNAVRFQSTYKKRIEVGLSPGDKPCKAGLAATAQIINAGETYEYKREYDQAFKSHQWNMLDHRVIELKNQAPTIAVSTLFSLDHIDAPQTPRATLSIFPTNNGVAVVFSATNEDSVHLDTQIHSIIEAQDHFQKYLISKHVLEFCENFVINPGYYSLLSEDQKNTLLDFFVRTVSTTSEDGDDPRLYLF